MFGAFFSAQSQVLVTPVQHRLGLHAGTTSGLGLSYKLVLNDAYEIQLTALPFASKDSKMMFSGLNLGYKFYNNKKLDVLVLLSSSYLYDQSVSEGYNYTDYNGNYIVIDDVVSTTSKVNSSLGVGFELGTSEMFKFNFQVGYGIYNMFSSDWQTLPSIGVGFDFLLLKKKK